MIDDFSIHAERVKAFLAFCGGIKSNGTLGLAKVFQVTNNLLPDHSQLLGIVRARLRVFDDFLGENFGVGKVLGIYKAFVSQPEYVEACFVAVVDETQSQPLPSTTTSLHQC